MSSNVNSAVLMPTLELFDIKYESQYVMGDLPTHARNFYNTHNHHELSNDFNIFMHAQPTSDLDPIVLVNPNTVIPKISSNHAASAGDQANVSANDFAASTSAAAAAAAAAANSAVTAAAPAISSQEKTDMAQANASFSFNTDSIPVERNGYFSQFNLSNSNQVFRIRRYAGYEGLYEEENANANAKVNGHENTFSYESSFMNAFRNNDNDNENENYIDLDDLFEPSSLVPMLEAETSTVRLVPSQAVRRNDAMSGTLQQLQPLQSLQPQHQEIRVTNSSNWNGLSSAQPMPLIFAPQHSLTASSTATSTTCLPSSSSSSASSSSSSTGKNFKRRRRRNDSSTSVTSTSMSLLGPGTPTSSTMEAASTCPYPKPAYSYSCLITLALKNSPTGKLRVSEIYNFLCQHFPFFKTAPTGWKNSVRHNLSLNKCFEKIEKTTNGSQAKGCYWTIHTDKMKKMDDEMLKWSRKDPNAIRKALQNPEDMEALENGDFKHHAIVSGNVSPSEDGESDSTEDNSDEFLEIHKAITAEATTSTLTARVAHNGLPSHAKRHKHTIGAASVRNRAPVQQDFFLESLGSEIHLSV